MKVVNADRVICFDVDDTLVMWNYSEHDIDATVEVGCEHFIQRVLPHQKHIQAIKNSKARGHYVVVWSQGGADWAKVVVEALKLSDYVDLVIAKPSWIYDDIPAAEWMPKPFYYPLEKK